MHNTCQKGLPRMSKKTQYLSERMTSDELQHTILVRKDDLGWVRTHSTCQKGWV